MIKLYKKYKEILWGIILLALPAIAETSLVTLLGMVDTLMIGRFVSTDALSGVGFANQFMMLIIRVFASFNIGATALISRNYGKKDYDRLNKIASQTVLINAVIGVFITIAGVIFREQIFYIYDLSDSVREIAISYFTIVMTPAIFLFISFSCTAILRGAGDTKTPMYVTGFTNIVNILLNFVFILGLGPIPAMGASGAALATSISRGIGALLYLYILCIRNEKVRLKMKDFKVSKDVLEPLWKISYPGAIEQVLMQGSFLVAGVIITTLDTNSESAFRVLISIESLSFMPAVGLATATATLVGKDLGKEKPKRALMTGYGSTFLGIAWGIFIGIFFLLFPRQLLSAFTPDKGVIEAGYLTMIWAGFNQAFLNPFIILSGALRGAGDTRGVMVIAALRVWIVFVPVSYITITYLGCGVEGLWIGEIMSFILFGALLFKRFHDKKWMDIHIEGS